MVAELLVVQDHAMALDPGLAALAGTALGVFGTLAVSFMESHRQHRDSIDVAKREDHVRDLDRRRDLYTRCVAAQWEYSQNVAAAGILASDRPRAAELILRSKQEAARLYEQLSVAREAMDGLRAEIDLLAPNSVRNAFAAMVDLAYELHRSVEQALRGEIEQTIIPHNKSQPQAKHSLRDLGDSYRDFVSAIRADLRIQEPD